MTIYKNSKEKGFLQMQLLLDRKMFNTFNVNSQQKFARKLYMLKRKLFFFCWKDNFNTFKNI